MIFSFSVPENNKNARLIAWYKSHDISERSRKFREIFLTYLEKSHHTIDPQTTNHVSLDVLNMIKLDKMDLVANLSDVDLDDRLNAIGIGGDQFV
jgi:hypothetical protein